jgi:hypothetical protein
MLTHVRRYAEAGSSNLASVAPGWGRSSEGRGSSKIVWQAYWRKYISSMRIESVEMMCRVRLTEVEVDIVGEWYEP